MAIETVDWSIKHGLPEGRLWGGHWQLEKLLGLARKITGGSYSHRHKPRKRRWSLARQRADVHGSLEQTSVSSKETADRRKVSESHIPSLHMIWSTHEKPTVMSRCQQPSQLYLSAHIWVNYNNSLTWIKAIWGWFPLLAMISDELVVSSL